MPFPRLNGTLPHWPGSRHTFRHAGIFWIGCAVSAVGVALHLPMYIASSHMGYKMAGMHASAALRDEMYVGMTLIVLGIAASVYGLIPRQRPAAPSIEGLVAVLGATRMTRAVIQLLVVLAIAVVIDATHPITLGFVAPGMASEYNLTSASNPHGGMPVALVPLAGITGTVLGSFAWGWLGDRIGRRASIILAGELFMTTAICGAMPTYEWNLLMCFMMGIGAGGMLPITFALIAESVPARHRGWVMVLIGGEVSGAYALVSWQASALIPHFGWRMMWLIGMPTGALLILLCRWIPESPRFLLAYGRVREARAVMDGFGMRPEQRSREAVAPAVAGVVALNRGRFAQLWARGLTGKSTALVLLGVGVGFVTYGFQLWIPSILQHMGLTSSAADGLLRNSALIGYPFTFLAAWMYGFWSSKKTILILTAMTIAALIGFVAFGNSLVGNHVWFLLLLAVPILASGSVVAVLGAYSSEIYPTVIRGRGGGLAAGASKAGGVVVIALVAAAVASPDMRTTALLGAAPLLLALVAVALWGIETSKRDLEEISDETAPVLSVGLEGAL